MQCQFNLMLIIRELTKLIGVGAAAPEFGWRRCIAVYKVTTNCSVLTGVMPGLVYGTHAGTVADMTACMSQMSVYQQQQQQHFGV